jgi:hypothetical protein
VSGNLIGKPSMYVCKESSELCDYTKSAVKSAIYQDSTWGEVSLGLKNEERLQKGGDIVSGF